MAIKDKNGKVYQLRGPNPLLKEQAEWDRKQVELHNFKWGAETVEDQRHPIKEFEANLIDIGQELNLDNQTKFVKATDFIQEAKVAVKEPNVVVIETDQKTFRMLKERGVEYFCAPVIDYRTHQDELYGTEFKTPVYGETFIFDAIVIDESDLEIQFWCIKPLSKGSVIYQRVKEGNWERRWWKIERTEAKTGGYLTIAIVSDVNPSFE